MHGYGSFFATKKFIKQVKRISPDIIHLHDIHDYYINLKVLFDYLNTAGIPVVFLISIRCGIGKWQKELPHKTKSRYIIV